MKTIGLIGGMSWESTTTYYQLLNTMTRDKLGGLHSAEILLWSFDFARIEDMQARGDWAAAADALADVAVRLEKAGAACILICTNTMHKLAGEVSSAVAIPLLHIADATGMAIKAAGVQKPLLMATRYTMEQSFYKGFLQQHHNIECVVPDDAGRTVVHDIIYNELCQGKIIDSSRDSYVAIVNQALRDGADSIIFGCTEVGLLLKQDMFDVPCFDTTELHAAAAIDFAIAS